MERGRHVKHGNVAWSVLRQVLGVERSDSRKLNFSKDLQTFSRFIPRSGTSPGVSALISLGFLLVRWDSKKVPTCSPFTLQIWNGVVKGRLLFEKRRRVATETQRPPRRRSLNHSVFSVALWQMR